MTSIWDLLQNSTQEGLNTIFLYAIAPLYLLHQLSGAVSRRLQGHDYPKIALNVSLGCLCCLELSKMIPELSDAWTNGLQENLSPPTAAKSAALASMLIVMALERVRGLTFSMSSAVFWGTVTFICGVYLGQTVSTGYEKLQTYDVMIIVVSGALTSAQFVLTCFAPRDDVKLGEHEDPHPEVQSSVLGTIFMSWMTSYIWNCYRHGLKEDDPPEITKADRCSHLCPKFEDAIQKEKDTALEGFDESKSSPEQEAETNKKKNNVFDHAFRTAKTDDKADDKPDDKSDDMDTDDDNKDPKMKATRLVLFKALWKTFGLKYSFAQCLMSCAEISHILSALVMESVIRFIQNRDNEPEWKGYGLALTVFFMHILTESGRHRAISLIRRMNKRMKVCLKSVVFKKALLAKNESKSYLTNGEVSTLISDDCEKIVSPLGASHIIITCPIQLIWGLTILYHEVGMGAFAGFAIMAVACPLNVKIGKLLKKHDIEKTD